MRVCVAVVIFVMVSIVFAAEDSPRPTPSIEKAKQKIEEAQFDKAKTQENQPAVRVIEIKPIAGQRDADYKAGEEKTNSDKPRNYTLLLSVLTAIFTGALVITGVLQYCVYKAQAKIMRRQLKASRLTTKAAQQSADAAKMSAEAVVAQAKVMEYRERPWITITPDTPFRWENGATSPARIPFTLANIGSSPAFMTGLFITVEVITLPLPEGRPRYQDGGHFTEFVIPPNGTHKNDASRDLTQVELDSFMNGQSALVFYGAINYRGSFSGPHHTYFYTCWEWRNGRLMFSPVGPAGSIDYT